MCVCLIALGRVKRKQSGEGIKREDGEEGRGEEEEEKERVREEEGRKRTKAHMSEGSVKGGVGKTWRTINRWTERKPKSKK